MPEEPPKGPDGVEAGMSVSVDRALVSRTIHDLRNALNSLLMNAAVLTGKLPPADRDGRFARQVQADGERCAALLQALCDGLRPPADPLVDDDSAPVAGAAAAGRVLVVDDDADGAGALRFLLQLEHLQVQTACDGESALAAADRSPPDVVLCDLRLPDMDGCEVARRLRARFGDAVHLCAYSGYDDPDDVARSRAAGFDAHIAKPGAPAVLLAEIRRGLSRRGTNPR